MECCKKNWNAVRNFVLMQYELFPGGSCLITRIWFVLCFTLLSPRIIWTCLVYPLTNDHRHVQANAKITVTSNFQSEAKRKRKWQWLKFSENKKLRKTICTSEVAIAWTNLHWEASKNKILVIKSKRTICEGQGNTNNRYEMSVGKPERQRRFLEDLAIGGRMN